MNTFENLFRDAWWQLWRMCTDPKRFVLLPVVCFICRHVFRMTPVQVSQHQNKDRMDTFAGFLVMWVPERIMITVEVELDPEKVVQVRADGQGVEPIA